MMGNRLVDVTWMAAQLHGQPSKYMLQFAYFAANRSAITDNPLAVTLVSLVFRRPSMSFTGSESLCSQLNRLHLHHPKVQLVPAEPLLRHLFSGKRRANFQFRYDADTLSIAFCTANKLIQSFTTTLTPIINRSTKCVVVGAFQQWH